MVLGTAQFGLNYGISNKIGKPSMESIIVLLDFALKNGVIKLDTASAYGNSEEVIGNSGLSSNFQIISKLPKIAPGNSNIGGIACDSIYKSLKKLKTNNLYAFLLHSIDDLNCYGDELWKQLVEVRKLKKTSRIGYSVYEPKQLEKFYEKYRPDIVQLPMNVLDREFQNSGWLKRMKEDGVEIHIRSIFLQGLLLIDKEDQIEKFPSQENIWNAWKQYLNKNNVSAMEACLNFIRKNELISDMVIGVNNQNELAEILSLKHKETPFFEFSSNDLSLINPSNWNL
jgi:aryl-alcohol dehydrogenase-like predicted oxidoreductase